MTIAADTLLDVGERARERGDLRRGEGWDPSLTDRRRTNGLGEASVCLSSSLSPSSFAACVCRCSNSSAWRRRQTVSLVGFGRFAES